MTMNPLVDNFSCLWVKLDIQKDTLERMSAYISMVGDIGFEPITSTTSMWRSSQMS